MFILQLNYLQKCKRRFFFQNHYFLVYINIFLLLTHCNRLALTKCLVLEKLKGMASTSRRGHPFWQGSFIDVKLN